MSESKEDKDAMPQIKLQRPAHPAWSFRPYGIWLVGAIIALAVVISIIAEFKDAERRQAAVHKGTAIDFAQEVINQTKQMTEPVPQRNQFRPDDAPGRSTLGGVSFEFRPPPGWTTDKQGRQLFFKDPAGQRVCQLVGQTDFDLKGFVKDAGGREAEWEAEMIRQMMEEGARMAAKGGAPKMAARGTLIEKESSDSSLRYVVRVTTAMAFQGQQITRRQVVSVAAEGKNALRAQCANTSADTDPGSAMELFLKSIRLSGGKPS
jgi:hypothetical protein